MGFGRACICMELDTGLFPTGGKIRRGDQGSPSISGPQGALGLIPAAALAVILAIVAGALATTIRVSATVARVRCVAVAIARSFATGADTIGVATGIAAGVAVGVTIGVAIRVTIGVAIRVTIGVAIRVAIGVAIGVAIRVAVSVSGAAAFTTRRSTARAATGAA